MPLPRIREETHPEDRDGDMWHPRRPEDATADEATPWRSGKAHPEDGDKPAKDANEGGDTWESIGAHQGRLVRPPFAQPGRTPQQHETRLNASATHPGSPRDVSHRCYRLFLAAAKHSDHRHR